MFIHWARRSRLNGPEACTSSVTGSKISTLARVNKRARIAWLVLAGGEDY